MMANMKRVMLIHGFFAITLLAASANYSLEVNLDRGDGYYRVGDETICTATLMNDGRPAVGEKLRAMMPWIAKNRLVDKAKN